MLTHGHGQPRTASFFRSSASSNWRPRRATRRGPAEPIPQGPALPVVAPAAVGQGPVAADSLHRCLQHYAPGTAGGSRGCAELRFSSLRARPGRGRRTVPFPPPNRGVTPSGSANGWDARAAGTRARGAPSPALSPAGARLLQPGLLIYLQAMCAPRRHGNRSIFSGVTRVPRFQTSPGQGLLRGGRFSSYSGPLCRDAPLLSVVRGGVFIHSLLQPSTVNCPPFSGMGIPITGISKVFPLSPHPPSMEVL